MDARCCNRICSWAKFRDKTQGGRVFFVFNVHFDHEGRVARRESGKLMTEKIKAIAQGAPAICTGDFNSADTTEQIGLLAAFMSDARAASVAKPYGVRGTFTTRFANPIQERIDYIFVSSHFRTAKYAVLTDNNGAYYPSDHLPVAVELLWE